MLYCVYMNVFLVNLFSALFAWSHWKSTMSTSTLVLAAIRYSKMLWECFKFRECPGKPRDLIRV